MNSREKTAPRRGGLWRALSASAAVIAGTAVGGAALLLHGTSAVVIADEQSAPRGVSLVEARSLAVPRAAGDVDLDGYVDSYYAQTVLEPAPLRAPLQHGALSASVCVVGGGLAGLATAVGLAERGVKDVVLLESRRVGWSASGRNGGFALAGYALESDELIEAVGAPQARRLYQYSVDAQKLLRERIDKYGIRCSPEDTGCATLSYFPPDDGGEDEVARAVADENVVFNAKFEFWPQSRVAKLYRSGKYYHGFFDPTAFAVHPLNLTLGLARVAEQLGVRIYERTRVDGVVRNDVSNASHRFTVRTEHGSTVQANHVVLAGSAQLPGSVERRVSHSVVPVLTYIMVTKPLGDALHDAIRAPHMVCDNRFALNYYRPLPGGRLLWGGFCQTYPISDAKLKEIMVADLLSVYPQLAGKVEVESAWGGEMGYGASMMPMIGQRSPGLWYATGFGGHGVVPTTVAGELIASGIAEHDQTYRVFERLFPLRYAGWPFGAIGAQLFYWYAQATDAWKLSRLPPRASKSAEK